MKESTKTFIKINMLVLTVLMILTIITRLGFTTSPDDEIKVGQLCSLETSTHCSTSASDTFLMVTRSASPSTAIVPQEQLP